MGAMKDLVKGYLRAYAVPLLEWREDTVRDLHDVDAMMRTNFSRLVEICFEAEIEIKDLVDWAEEVRQEAADK